MTASKLSFWNRIFDDIISREVYSRLGFTSEWMNVHILRVPYIFSLLTFFHCMRLHQIYLFCLYFYREVRLWIYLSYWSVLSRFHVFILFSYIKAAWCLYIKLRELRISIVLWKNDLYYNISYLPLLTDNLGHCKMQYWPSAT